jgi:phosphoribosylglycinamide formyltransferase-1
VKSIVVLISGQGSNMAALIDACEQERWPARIAAVISNRSDAKGLVSASQKGVATEVLEHRGFADREAYDRALIERIDLYGADLVVLAGFMRILSAHFVNHYAGRLLNIHPSLLPAFTGLHPHRQALEAGVKVHGATVHLVTDQLDAGPIVMQAAVPVFVEDDEDALAARVLKVEHQIYPRAVRWFVEDKVEIANGRVQLRHPGEMMQLGVAS